MRERKGEKKGGREKGNEKEKEGGRKIRRWYTSGFEDGESKGSLARMQMASRCWKR